VIPITVIFTPLARKAPHNNGCSLVPKYLNAYGQQVLVVKSEGIKHLEESTCRWEDITMDFIGIEWRSVDRVYHDQDRAHYYPSLKGIIQIWTS
jgi:hypothetical protein